MASSTTAPPTPNAYTYQKPSTLATRTLVTGDRPAESPSSASNDQTGGAHDKPTLQRGRSTNYADAAAAVAAAAAAAGSTGTAPTADTARPGLDRQQSWKLQDLKREHVEKMLGGPMPGGGMGYTSTQK